MVSKVPGKYILKLEATKAASEAGRHNENDGKNKTVILTIGNKSNNSNNSIIVKNNGKNKAVTVTIGKNSNSSNKYMH